MGSNEGEHTQIHMDNRWFKEKKWRVWSRGTHIHSRKLHMDNETKKHKFVERVRKRYDEREHTHTHVDYQRKKKLWERKEGGV